MSTVPTSPAKQAREALGVRLREIRKEAGLTGRALAVGIGCHYTKISRVENGSQAPSEGNIRAWCRACRAEDQLPDLIATARTIETMYVEWRRQTRAGMKRLLLSSVPLYERTKLFSAFLEVTQPREIRLYATMFEQLQQSAVYGPEARALVTRAMADLASGWGDAN